MKVPRLKKKPKYPVPGPAGGKLIRQVIAGFRAAGVPLPITSDILLAISAGSDSTALAHLLLRYGRRVVAPERITLLHINHGWRGEASDGDEAFVIALGKKMGARTVTHRVSSENEKGRSREDSARQRRLEVFAAESERRGGALVVTAHQADDVAETMLWRLLTGSAETHGGGIRPRHGIQIRPLLQIRKEMLKRYLKEEGQNWREDATNAEGVLLRSRLRKEVMPALERIFPRGVEHLAKLAARAIETKKESSGLREVFGALQIPARRPHWEQIEKSPDKELHLPGGWKIRRESEARWVIERPGSEVSRVTKYPRLRKHGAINVGNNNGT